MTNGRFDILLHALSPCFVPATSRDSGLIKVTTIPLRPNSLLRVGRSRSQCDVIILDSRVSRIQCGFFWCAQTGKLFLVDGTSQSDAAIVNQKKSAISSQPGVAEASQSGAAEASQSGAAEASQSGAMHAYSQPDSLGMQTQPDTHFSCYPDMSHELEDTIHANHPPPRHAESPHAVESREGAQEPITFSNNGSRFQSFPEPQLAKAAARKQLEVEDGLADPVADESAQLPLKRRRLAGLSRSVNPQPPPPIPYQRFRGHPPHLPASLTDRSSKGGYSVAAAEPVAADFAASQELAAALRSPPVTKSLGRSRSAGACPKFLAFPGAQSWCVNGASLQPLAPSSIVARSMNGTYVNGRLVDASRPVALTSGSEVSFVVPVSNGRLADAGFGHPLGFRVVIEETGDRSSDGISGDKGRDKETPFSGIPRHPSILSHGCKCALSAKLQRSKSQPEARQRNQAASVVSVTLASARTPRSRVGCAIVACDNVIEGSQQKADEVERQTKEAREEHSTQVNAEARVAFGSTPKALGGGDKAMQEDGGDKGEDGEARGEDGEASGEDGEARGEDGEARGKDRGARGGDGEAREGDGGMGGEQISSDETPEEELLPKSQPAPQHAHVHEERREPAAIDPQGFAAEELLPKSQPAPQHAHVHEESFEAPAKSPEEETLPKSQPAPPRMRVHEERSEPAAMDAQGCAEEAGRGRVASGLGLNRNDAIVLLSESDDEREGEAGGEEGGLSDGAKGECCSVSHGRRQDERVERSDGAEKSSGGGDVSREVLECLLSSAPIVECVAAKEMILDCSEENGLMGKTGRIHGAEATRGGDAVVAMTGGADEEMQVAGPVGGGANGVAGAARKEGARTAVRRRFATEVVLEAPRQSMQEESVRAEQIVQVVTEVAGGAPACITARACGGAGDGAVTEASVMVGHPVREEIEAVAPADESASASAAVATATATAAGESTGTAAAMEVQGVGAVTDVRNWQKSDHRCELVTAGSPEPRTVAHLSARLVVAPAPESVAGAASTGAGAAEINVGQADSGGVSQEAKAEHEAEAEAGRGRASGSGRAREGPVEGSEGRGMGRPLSGMGPGHMHGLALNRLRFHGMWEDAGARTADRCCDGDGGGRGEGGVRGGGDVSAALAGCEETGRVAERHQQQQQRLKPPAQLTCKAAVMAAQQQDPEEVSLHDLFHPMHTLQSVFAATFTLDLDWFLEYLSPPSEIPMTIAVHDKHQCWDPSPTARLLCPCPTGYPNLKLLSLDHETCGIGTEKPHKKQPLHSLLRMTLSQQLASTPTALSSLSVPPVSYPSTRYPLFPDACRFGREKKAAGIGCHHPKLFLLFRAHSLRVVVSSANLNERQDPSLFSAHSLRVVVSSANLNERQPFLFPHSPCNTPSHLVTFSPICSPPPNTTHQWQLISNTIWWQDFPRCLDFPRRPSPLYSSLFSPLPTKPSPHSASSSSPPPLASDFASELASFIAPLVAHSPSEAHWVLSLASFDFSRASAVLVASVPGVHRRPVALPDVCRASVGASGGKGGGTARTESERATGREMRRETAAAASAAAEETRAALLGCVHTQVVGVKPRYGPRGDPHSTRFKCLMAALCGEGRAGRARGERRVMLQRALGLPGDGNAVAVMLVGQRTEGREGGRVRGGERGIGKREGKAGLTGDGQAKRMKGGGAEESRIGLEKEMQKQVHKGAQEQGREGGKEDHEDEKEREEEEGEQLVQLGYLPRGVARWVAPVMDAGVCAVEGRVAAEDVHAAASGRMDWLVPIRLVLWQRPFFSLSPLPPCLRHSNPPSLPSSPSTSSPSLLPLLPLFPSLSFPLVLSQGPAFPASQSTPQFTRSSNGGTLVKAGREGGERDGEERGVSGTRAECSGVGCGGAESSEHAPWVGDGALQCAVVRLLGALERPRGLWRLQEVSGVRCSAVRWGGVWGSGG
ncbi:unnamed protein product [Closterium sp. NIES-53]